MYQSFYNSPIGKIVLYSDGNFLTNLFFSDMEVEGQKEEIEIFQTTKKWLDIYFSGMIPNFTPEYKFKCLTPFQNKVLTIISSIPYGEVMTYKDIANKISINMSSQAVGNALHINPIAIIIPCHRVVSKNGLGGYAYGMNRKKFLLNLEEKKNRIYE